MSEELIIEHCSPTLVGIKTGNMFPVRVTEDADINAEIRELNKALRVKGLRVIPLKKTDEYALIYLYRPDYLKKDLNDPQALSILKERGYEPENPECCMRARNMRSEQNWMPVLLRNKMVELGILPGI